MRILLADGDPAWVRGLARQMEKEYYSVQVVYNGADALKHLETANYDAAILEMVLPEMDGISVLKTMRTQGQRIPVLILSAKAEVDDIVRALDSGANDYLAKPFEIRELLARLRVITRSPEAVDSTLSVGNVTLNRATYEMSTPAGCVRLLNKEFQTMEMLMINPSYLISTERFMEKIWGYDANVENNVVWVYISYLRRKLKTLEANIVIKSMRNTGYRLEAKEVGEA